MGVVFNQMDDAVDAAMHCSVMIVFVTEVLAEGLFLIVGDVDSVPDQFFYTEIFCGGNWDDRHA